MLKYISLLNKLMLAILSPSKTQDFETPSRSPIITQPIFQAEILELVDILKAYNPNDIGKLMSISEKLSHLNFERYQNFQPDFNPKNSKPAIEAFQGDVYRDIDTENYTESDFKFAQDHIRTISGLYGLLRPLDLIQPYRLEMKTKLQTDHGKDLYQFWGSKITDQLNKEDQPIINLASNEYSKVIQLGKIKQPVIGISFKENKNGTYKTIAIYSKIARGTMANYIVKNKPTKPEELRKFSEDGYAYSPEHSTEHRYIFLRS